GLLLAIFTAAAPPPLVVALPEVTLEVTTCVVLPIPVTAVAVKLAVLISIPAPLPWIEPVRAVSVSAFVPVFRIVTAGVLLLVLVPVSVPVFPRPEKSDSGFAPGRRQSPVRPVLTDPGYSRSCTISAADGARLKVWTSAIWPFHNRALGFCGHAPITGTVPPVASIVPK